MNRGLAPRRQVDSTRAQLRDPEVNMDKRPTDLYEGEAAGTLPPVGKTPGRGSEVEVKWQQAAPGRFERLVADLVRKLTNNEED